MALLALKDLEHEHRVGKIDDADYTTIGGVVFGTLGRLPKPGDRVELSGASFEVVEMEGRRVGRVRVTRPAAAEPVEN